MRIPAIPHTVTLYGSGDPAADSLAFAEELGRGIGARGWVLRNGGYGGTMAAAARGARLAGGEVVGVTCGAFRRGGANSHVTATIETRDLYGRLAGLIEGADAFGAFAGGTGTLTEVFLTWELMVKELLAPRPLCLLGQGWDRWWDLWSRDPVLAPRLDLLSRASDLDVALLRLAPREGEALAETVGWLERQQAGLEQGG